MTRAKTLESRVRVDQLIGKSVVRAANQLIGVAAYVPENRELPATHLRTADSALANHLSRNINNCWGGWIRTTDWLIQSHVIENQFHCASRPTISKVDCGSGATYSDNQMATHPRVPRDEWPSNGRNWRTRTPRSAKYASARARKFAASPAFSLARRSAYSTRLRSSIATCTYSQPAPPRPVTLSSQTRLPPPGKRRPSFLVSRWTRSPGTGRS